MTRFVKAIVFSWVGVVTFFLGVSITVGIYFALRSDCRDSNCVERESGTLSLRVYRQYTWDLHYRYVFQSTSNSSAGWKTILSVTHEEPLNALEQRIRIVSGNVMYAYTKRVFAVSIDGGENWSFFDVQTDSEIGRKTDEGMWIEKLEIGSDGVGTLTPKFGYRQRSIVFRTADYGRNWEESTVSNSSP